MGRGKLKKRKKINFGIKRELQIWFLIRILGITLLAILFAGILAYLYARNFVDAEFLRFQVNTKTTAEIFWPVFLAASLTSIVAGLLLVLFLPPKIAGPLYRVEKDLDQIGSGDLTKNITLRSGDILSEQAEAVNMAVSQICGLVNEVKEAGNALGEKIDAGDSEEIRSAFEHLRKQLDRIISCR